MKNWELSQGTKDSLVPIVLFLVFRPDNHDNTGWLVFIAVMFLYSIFLLLLDIHKEVFRR